MTFKKFNFAHTRIENTLRNTHLLTLNTNNIDSTKSKCSTTTQTNASKSKSMQIFNMKEVNKTPKMKSSEMTGICQAWSIWNTLCSYSTAHIQSIITVIMQSKLIFTNSREQQKICRNLKVLSWWCLRRWHSNIALFSRDEKF